MGMRIISFTVRSFGKDGELHRRSCYSRGNLAFQALAGQRRQPSASTLVTKYPLGHIVVTGVSSGLLNRRDP